MDQQTNRRTNGSQTDEQTGRQTSMHACIRIRMYVWTERQVDTQKDGQSEGCKLKSSKQLEDGKNITFTAMFCYLTGDLPVLNPTSFELVKCLELLSHWMGTAWMDGFLIRQLLWPVIKDWMSSVSESKEPSQNKQRHPDAPIATICRFLGECTVFSVIHFISLSACDIPTYPISSGPCDFSLG